MPQADAKHELHLRLDRDLVAALKEYQHDHRLDSLTQAVDRLLREGLGLKK